MNKELTPIEQVGVQMESRQQEFMAVLPKHISFDKFKRVVVTAVASNPELVECDRRTLLVECVKAATDGLLPDGRQAALVIFKTQGQRVAVYMPMIAGVIQRVRNSGELKAIDADVVCAGDEFAYERGDNPRLYHRPKLTDRGPVYGAYAVAWLTNGMIEREYMPKEEIDDVRNVSRAKKGGPWFDWYNEMAKKTVIRRLAKRLPMSGDLEDLMHRDDDLYDLNRVDQPVIDAPARPQRIEYEAGPTEATEHEEAAAERATAIAEQEGVPPDEAMRRAEEEIQETDTAAASEPTAEGGSGANAEVRPAAAQQSQGAVETINVPTNDAGEADYFGWAHMAIKAIKDAPESEGWVNAFETAHYETITDMEGKEPKQHAKVTRALAAKRPGVEAAE